MSPDLLPFLFLVTSTALVLGAAVTLRGIYGLVSDSTPRLPASAPSSATVPEDPNEAGSSTSPDPADHAAAPAAGPRDLREPLIMTIGGVFICAGALMAVAMLVNSAP